MYKPTEQQQSLNLFPMHLLKKHDEWIILTEIMPWFEIENLFIELFKENGRYTLPIRVIIGALIIQTKLGLTDRDTVDIISSTPRYQYFLGLNDFDPEYSFDFTNLCKYRTKIGIDITKEMIDVLIKDHKVKVKDSKPKDVKNYGTLSIDATVVPVNITYPADLKLLNKTRVESEKLIDELYKASDLKVKPRTYRKEARETFLSSAKKKRLSKSARFSANRKQLQYLNRNIETIETHVDKAIFTLNDIQKETLETIKQIYLQQYHMWEHKINTVKDRVVNFHQPHIRGIVRGKAGTRLKFGPKIAVSKVNGFIEIDKISFSNFNESTTLKDIANDYLKTYGFYPESIRADQIYQTRDNKIWCKENHIRLSGKPLGRPKKEKDPKDDQVMKNDMKQRIEIEAVFGTAKTKYGLSNLMTKLPDTQKASIGLVFFVMNLMQILRKSSFLSDLEVAYFLIKESEVEYIFEENDIYFKN